EGTFSVSFQSKSSSVAQAISIVNEEIERLRTTKVGVEELSTAIIHAVEVLPLRFGSPGQKVAQFADDYYSKLPEDYWQKYTRRVRAVTAEEIQRVARKYLQPERFVFLVVGDVDTIMLGNPDRSQYSIAKLAGPRGMTRILLPDPLTLVYPARVGQ